MKFREALPRGCPPENAHEISQPKVVYRITRAAPPTADDFRSQRAENPDTQFRVSECQACGLSVFAAKADCELALKLPKLRGRSIAKVTLVHGAGYLNHTPNRERPSHHTWWPFAAYDILGNCESCAA